MVGKHIGGCGVNMRTGVPSPDLASWLLRTFVRAFPEIADSDKPEIACGPVESGPLGPPGLESPASRERSGPFSAPSHQSWLPRGLPRHPAAPPQLRPAPTLILRGRTNRPLEKRPAPRKSPGIRIRSGFKRVCRLDDLGQLRDAVEGRTDMKIPPAPRTAQTRQLRQASPVSRAGGPGGGEGSGLQARMPKRRGLSAGAAHRRAGYDPGGPHAGLSRFERRCPIQSAGSHHGRGKGEEDEQGSRAANA